jgi:hypothetical protein
MTVCMGSLHGQSAWAVCMDSLHGHAHDSLHGQLVQTEYTELLCSDVSVQMMSVLNSSDSSTSATCACAAVIACLG